MLSVYDKLWYTLSPGLLRAGGGVLVPCQKSFKVTLISKHVEWIRVFKCGLGESII